MPSDALLTQPAPPVPRLLLTTRQAAEALAVSQAYLRELTRRREIVPIRLPCAGTGRPRALRFPVDELQNWIKRRMGDTNRTESRAT